MKFTVALLFAILGLARSQFGGFGGSNFGGGYGFNSFNGGGIDAPLQNARDARANTGPVVFPAAPEDNGETSGVVVGASGFGFVPPNSPSARPQQYSFY